MTKLNIIVANGLNNFLEWSEYLDDYDVKIHVVKNEMDIVNGIRDADIVWFEFANEAAIRGTRIIEDNTKAGVKKPDVYVRLHGYEAFHPNLLPNIKWNTVNRLIYVSPANLIIMQDYHAELLKSLEPQMVQISNGVNLDKHPFKERKHGMNIGLIGYLNNKKNSQEAIHIIKELCDGFWSDHHSNDIDKLELQEHRDYKLHIAGTFQDRVLESYFKHAIKEYGLEKNVIMHGWLKGHEMEELWDSLNYVLCTSITESFGYNIAEGMARGIKPVIHNFIGAEKIWDSKYIYDNAAARIECNGDRYHSKEYREYIEDNYDLKMQVDTIKGMLNAT